MLLPAEYRLTVIGKEVNLRVGIIGNGKVGCSLAALLLRKGFLTGIRGADERKSAAAAEELGVAYRSLRELAECSELLVLTVPDRKISAAAEQLASSGGGLHGKVVLHCSGASDLSCLQSVAAKGAHVGSFHPLQSFAGKCTELEGIYAAVDGDDIAAAAAEELAQQAGAHSFRVPPRERALYHAAACICSNYAVTMAAVAQGIMSAWIGDGGSAWQALKPLFAGTSQNLLHAPAAQDALTGPIARGDVSTVAAHLKVLPPEAAELYRVVGMRTAEFAAEAGKFDGKILQEFEGLFQGGSHAE